MVRFSKVKLVTLALVVIGATLAVGVALAANQEGSGSSGAASPQLAAKNVEIIVETQTVTPGTPAVTVLGAGWTPYSSALVRIKLAAGENIILGGVTANSSGAWKLEVSELSKSIEAGIYTVNAVATTSVDEASAPLLVVIK